MVRPIAALLLTLVAASPALAAPAKKKAAPPAPLPCESMRPVASDPADPPVAKVGELVVLRSELDGIWDRLDPEVRRAWEGNGGKAGFLRELAAKKRLVLDACRRGLEKNVDVRLDLSIARDSILYDRFVVGVVMPTLVPEAEVRAAYETRRESFRLPLRFRARHILVTPTKEEKIANRNHDDAATAEDAAKKVDFLRKRLADGVAFDVLARDFSEDLSAERGGDLGWFGRGTMVPEFEKALMDLKPGSVSEPVTTDYGTHIIRLEAREEETVIPYEKIADRLRQELLIERMDEVQAKSGEMSDALEGEFPLVILDDALSKVN